VPQAYDMAAMLNGKFAVKVHQQNYL